MAHDAGCRQDLKHRSHAQFQQISSDSVTVVMASRERVMTALEHEEADRVLLNIGNRLLRAQVWQVGNVARLCGQGEDVGHHRLGNSEYRVDMSAACWAVTRAL